MILERGRKALEALASLPIEEFGWDKKSDDYPIYALNGRVLMVGHVKDARAALGLPDNLTGASQ